VTARLRISRQRTIVLCAGLLVLVTAASSPPGAHAITRDEVMTRARAFAYHPWRMSSSNATASCNSAYRSVYAPGDYMGLPYDWGGHMTLFEFDSQIAAGYGAGSYPDDGVLACTSGLDCSGFVSQTWRAGHHTTRNLATISTSVSATSTLAGDIFNKYGYHVSLYSHRLGNGEPVFFESIDYNVHLNASGGWAWVSEYTPLRYGSISGTTVSNPLGTLTNPIPIDSFPFQDSRDTRESRSSVLDRCAAAPDRNESGPEYVYRASFSQPGTLTVSVSDDVGVDIDVHLYRAANTNDCVARHDATFTRTVDCGTHLIVADTFGSGATNAGRYNLTVTFTPSGGSCGTSLPVYDPVGGPGDPCEYPGNPNLPFCNPNLGVDACLYTTSPPSSFCTRGCGATADCTGDFPGGCCVAIAAGESYCMPSTRCAGGGGGTSRPDAGIRGGGDPELTDGGVAADAGTPVVDAGAAVVDAGSPRDAGVRDAGAPDAGVRTPDAGTALEDAGTEPPADAGATGTDAGVRGRRDAGVTTDPPSTATSGCQSAGGGAASGLGWILALSATLWLRRRRVVRP
jgi:hypothetical protein